MTTIKSKYIQETTEACQHATEQLIVIRKRMGKQTNNKLWNLKKEKIQLGLRLKVVEKEIMKLQDNSEEHF